MTDAPASPLARLRSALARTDESRTDGQLLAAFVQHRDADAFAALVYRHGPRVLGVCRRVCGHDHDADDAFQAVFLVLARRAADVSPPEAVAAWLYGVAVRTAQDARTMAAQRRSRVTPTGDVPDVPGPELPDAELAAALDAEIARLPDHYRSAVVLCELTGVSRAEAAKRLGVAEGTLSSRLAEARKRLAVGLRRKGFALPATLPAVLPAGAEASGSESVFHAACRLGQLTAAGGSLPAGVPLTLADRMTRIMYLKKLTLLGAFAACGVVLLSAGWLTLRPALADDKPAVKAGAKAKPLNRLLVWRQGEAYLLDPDGKNEAKVFDRGRGESVNATTLSPDGKAVAYLTQTFEVGQPIPADQHRNHAVAVRKLDDKEATEFKVFGQMLAWSPDGKELVVTDFVDGGSPKDGPPKTTTTVLDVATKMESVAPLPDGHFALGFAPDGKRFVTMHYELKGEKPAMTACLVSRDGKEVTAISDPTMMAYMPRLSPDGKTLLYRGVKTPDKVPEKPIHNARLYVQSLGGKAVELADVPQNAEIQGYCWSPDGKRIAYTWRELHDKAVVKDVGNADTNSFLVVCDADGKNAKTIHTEKGMSQWHITLDHVDWR